MSLTRCAPKLSALLLVLLVLIAACGRTLTPTEQADAHVTTIRTALTDISAARTGHNLKAATAAQSAATTALQELTDLTTANPTLGLEPRLTEARELVAKLERELAFTREECYLNDLTSTWKARGFRTSRDLALRGVFTAMGLTAEQAEKACHAPTTGPATLPASVTQSLRSSADFVADLDADFTHRPLRPDGTPDWPAIAADLYAQAASPAPRVHLFLALGLIFTGRDELALIQLQDLDPARITDPDERLVYYVFRCILYNINGLRLLAQADMATISASDPTAPAYCGPELLSLLCLYLAYDAIQQKEYVAADMHCVRAMKLWPNNPLSVYLTGERLCAKGDYEKAAQSLENSLAGTSDAWLAERIAQRARQIRDEKGNARPLFTDKVFLTELALRYLAQKAATSPLARQISDWITTGITLTQKVLPSP